jgi:hypothetical protein
MRACLTCGAHLSRYAASDARFCALHERSEVLTLERRADAAQALLRWRWHGGERPSEAGRRLRVL